MARFFFGFGIGRRLWRPGIGSTRLCDFTIGWECRGRLAENAKRGGSAEIHAG